METTEKETHHPFLPSWCSQLIDNWKSRHLSLIFGEPMKEGGGSRVMEE
jgi:hypothetical protein